MTVSSVALNLDQYVRDTASAARVASRELATIDPEAKNGWLRRCAKLLRTRTAKLLEANRLDIDNAPDFGLTDAATDRLRLSEDRLEGIAQAVEQIALLPDPVGEVIEGSVRPNGLFVSRVRVPLGVVFFIFESRPNVTVDAAALCIKSGNAVILRGGKEAFHSNLALHALLVEAARETGIPPAAIQFVETTDREAVGEFLKQSETIDVTIPRGGKSLIERVSREATMPVIKHFDGNCHVFVDRAADLRMAVDITVNGKCQRPGVCNAVESLLVHADIAAEFLPLVNEKLSEQGVLIRGCDKTREYLPSAEAATDDDYRTEYLDLILSVKVIDGVESAIAHINEYGSHHTDAVVTRDLPTAEKFVAGVDSAAVMVNASTRFNDGGEFGLGAEIGISTDKFHARGPCGLRELTSYKYIARGTGQIKQ